MVAPAKMRLSATASPIREKADMSRFSNIGRYWQYADRLPNVCIANLLMQANVKTFPCREGGPDVKAPYTAKGYHAASTNPLMREIWLRDHPEAGWGVPCAPNNIIVLDSDRHGDADGVANLFALFQRHQFDHRSVPSVATPNDGMHFYFKRPAGLGQTRGTPLPSCRHSRQGICYLSGMPNGRWSRLPPR